MADLKALLLTIDTLKGDFDQLRPLKKENEERLWKKFRLEWNYNSNHIEGNTLTYGQTELLLFFEKTTGDHDIREYEEMKAHDVAIKLIEEYAADHDRELTESDVREINKIILVRPYWGNAQTPDGQPTRKLIQPGVYKKEPNSVMLQSGEMFHYASPEETPAKMNQLMDWLRSVSSEKKLHPVQIAAKLHYDFVRIHPFDDSNGRTSRLLMNYVLLRNGFPPVIIKSADKKGYLTALNKADVGDLDAFVVYISEQLIWSLKLSIKAAKGESVEEKDDLDKEIEVWKKTISSDLLRPPKQLSLIRNFFIESIIPLFDLYISKQKTFDSLFLENIISISPNYFQKQTTSISEIKKSLLDDINSLKENNPQFINDVYKISLTYEHLFYKGRPSIKKNFSTSVDIQFLPLVIKLIMKREGTIYFEKDFFYNQTISSEELDSLILNSVKDDFSVIKSL